jgi:hypothetical protein
MYLPHYFDGYNHNQVLEISQSLRSFEMTYYFFEWLLIPFKHRHPIYWGTPAKQRLDTSRPGV